MGGGLPFTRAGREAPLSPLAGAVGPVRPLREVCSDLCSALLRNLQHRSRSPFQLECLPASISVVCGPRGQPPSPFLGADDQVTGVCDPSSLGRSHWSLSASWCGGSGASGASQGPAGAGLPQALGAGKVSQQSPGGSESTFDRVGHSETEEGLRLEQQQERAWAALASLESHREGGSPGSAAVDSLGPQRKGALETGWGRGSPGRAATARAPLVAGLQGPLEVGKKLKAQRGGRGCPTASCPGSMS